ncbi:MAG: polysaccharide deacetylase family protein, partial [Thermus sp.]|nr:polysaccharide deacetylase family protein [Thermus sp.]
SIVLLHDGPERTLHLLSKALPRLLEVGYEPVTLDQLDPRPLGPREALIRGLQGFNERYDRAHGLKRVAYGPFDYLKYELKPFPFPPLRGRLALELHIDSERVVELSPFEVLRYTRKGLRELAKQLHEGKIPTVNVVYGFSYQAESMRVLGFEPFPHSLPRLSLWLAAISTMWQLWLYRGELPRLQRRAPASLMHLTLEDFLRRFLPSTPSSPRPAPGEGQTPPP